jgi:dihydrofolate synthase/folylpolyglutamate synthase
MEMALVLHTLDEALDYLYSFINYEVDSSFAYGAVHYNLDRTVKLLELLGNPHEHMQFIHVAGTKGKGSVCVMLDALLRSSGHRTGLFTSPHIDRVNERIAVSGKHISNEAFIELMNRFPQLLERFEKENQPTTFEILTAMAVLHFREEEASWVILETGMGGRFDSTNFCDPLASIITPISYDHMDKLGDRIEDIAGEKAGIIKPGKPVIVGYQVYDVGETISAAASTCNAAVYSVETSCSFTIRETSEQGSLFDARVRDRTVADVFLSLTGRHQVENALTAMLALELIHLLPDNRTVREAFTSIHIPTRLELIEGKRRFLLDSAHNKDSARVLAQALRESYRFERLWTIVGIVKDKDEKGIVDCLAAVSDHVIVTDPVTHKEIDTDRVFSAARTAHRGALLIGDIEEAIAYAIANSDYHDLILITGSFYTTSPARNIILKRWT